MDPWDCDGVSSIFLGTIDDISWEEGSTKTPPKAFRAKLVRDGLRIYSSSRDFHLFLSVDSKWLDRMEDVVRVRGRCTRNDGAPDHTAVAKLELINEDGRALLCVKSESDPALWFEVDIAMEEEEYDSEEESDDASSEDEEDVEDSELSEEREDEGIHKQKKMRASSTKETDVKRTAPLAKWLHRP